MNLQEGKELEKRLLVHVERLQTEIAEITTCEDKLKELRQERERLFFTCSEKLKELRSLLVRP